MENNNSFTLKDVIFNLLFIILFVFILLWLFPSKSFLNDKFDSISNCGNVNSNSQVNNNSKIQTNQIFNQNVSTMKEAAISYFTTPRLPKNVGDKVKMTLKEMRDKKLLLSLIDANGKICNEEESFVEITKNKDEYVLKVSLKCSDYEDYILVYLGCYDYCDGDVCEKETPKEIFYQYEYKLVKPCQMTGWSNWTNWTTNYIASNANRKVETKVETQTSTAPIQKTCPSGYLYNSYTNKCYKSSNFTDIKDAEVIKTYSCKTGFTLDKKDNTCKKEVTNTSTVAAVANPTTYNCDKYSGYTLSGKNCIKNITTTSTSTIDATKTPVYGYKCDEGTLSSDKKSCIITSSITDSIPAIKSCSTKTVIDCSTGSCRSFPQTSCTYSCQQGYTKSGTRCYSVRNETTNKPSTEYPVSYNYSCQNGYTLKNTSCTKTITNNTVDTKPATANPTTYYCKDKNYVLNGNMCSLTINEVVTEASQVTENYSCDKYGKDYTLNGKKCEKIIANAEVAEVILVCPTGYTKKDNTCVNTKNIVKYRFSERSCVGGSVDYKWSNSNNDQTLLKQGYVLTGNKKEIQSK